MVVLSAKTLHQSNGVIVSLLLSKFYGNTNLVKKVTNKQILTWVVLQNF